jgi:hypothetical protein
MAPHPYQQQTHEIVVDGQRQVVSQDRLIELAQKGVSSDSRYQEAASKSKEAEAAIAFKEDMELLGETGDIAAFRRCGAAMGLNGDEVEEAARLVYEQTMGDEGQEGSPPGEENDYLDTRGPERGSSPVAQRIAALEAELARTKSQLAKGPTGFNDLDDSLQTAILDVEQGRVDKIIQNSVDKDEFLSYYIGSADEKARGAIFSMIDEKVRGRLDASDGQFGDGTRILREVLPEVKEHLEALGTPSRSTPQMGFGPAPGGQGGADIYPRKQPDHVSSTEAGFEEHIMETLAHNEYKAKQGQ